jgi:hypothetical protein
MRMGRRTFPVTCGLPYTQGGETQDKRSFWRPLAMAPSAKRRPEVPLCNLGFRLENCAIREMGLLAARLVRSPIFTQIKPLGGRQAHRGVGDRKLDRTPSLPLSASKANRQTSKSHGHANP